MPKLWCDRSLTIGEAARRNVRDNLHPQRRFRGQDPCYNKSSHFIKVVVERDHSIRAAPGPYEDTVLIISRCDEHVEVTREALQLHMDDRVEDVTYEEACMYEVHGN